VAVSSSVGKAIRLTGRGLERLDQESGLPTEEVVGKNKASGVVPDGHKHSFWFSLRASIMPILSEAK
jgi:hypothetical protein